MGGELMGGVELMMMAGVTPMMAGEPTAGEPTPPLSGEPVEEPCGPLAPNTLALFVGGATSPQGTIAACGGCHTDPDQSSFVLPAYSAQPSALSDEQVVGIYEAVSPYLTPGSGATSQLTTRMTDQHAYTGYVPNDPNQQAMIAWIDALTSCDEER